MGTILKTISNDGTPIHFEVSGTGDTSLVFVHGWNGSSRWWDAQRDAFTATYQVVTLDLAGHGQSGSRAQGSGDAYANDILAVVRELAAPHVVLVAHSMGGGYATLACPAIPALRGLVLVDTLRDLDALPTASQAAPFLASCRADYAAALATTLPAQLFGVKTSVEVRERLMREFLRVPGDVAAALLEPLYAIDMCAAALRVKVPVRGIGGDLPAARTEANRAYFHDYAYTAMSGYGHYPMLEAPDAFNAALRGQLATIG